MSYDSIKKDDEAHMLFHERLRELRKQAELSQRELAESVGIDFTYLSKIENKKVEPPRQTVIVYIARVLASKLKANEVQLADELVTLAGKIPFDLAETLSKNPQAFAYLRSLSADVTKGSDWSRVTKPDQGKDKK